MLHDVMNYDMVMGQMEMTLLHKEYIYEFSTLVSKYSDYLYINVSIPTSIIWTNHGIVTDACHY